MEVHTMRPVPLRPAAAPAATQQPAQPVRYLTNDEAAVSCTRWPTSKPGRMPAASRPPPTLNTPSAILATAAMVNMAAAEVRQARHADGLRHVQSTSAASAGYAAARTARPVSCAAGRHGA